MTAGPWGENTVYILGIALFAVVALLGVAIRVIRYLWRRR